jgi:hypothetical protein
MRKLEWIIFALAILLLLAGCAALGAIMYLDPLMR